MTKLEPEVNRYLEVRGHMGNMHFILVNAQGL